MIVAMFQYPIKGFTPQAVVTAILSPGEAFPGDRLMAVEDGPCGFDPAAPAHIAKSRFTVLARSAAVAKVRTDYGLTTGILTAHAPGSPPFEASLAQSSARLAFVDWLTTCLAHLSDGAFAGPLRLVDGDGHRFLDHPRGHVSILNLASVRDLETRIGAPVDPARFRANIHVEGWPAWVENGWKDRTLDLGAVRARIFAPITRCAATRANPVSGESDIDIPAALHRLYGHILCGVYAHIEGPGEVSVGDVAQVL